ncbi:MAG: hypothetical protein ACRCW9_06290 [Cetobacterium sp.]
MCLESFLNVLDNLENNKIIYYIKIKEYKFCLMYNNKEYYDFFRILESENTVYGTAEEKKELGLNAKEYHLEIKKQILNAIKKKNLEKEDIQVYSITSSINKLIVINSLLNIKGALKI